MDQQVVDCDISQRDDFQMAADQTDPLIAILAEDQRLAMFEFDDVIRTLALFLGVRHRSVVEHVAVLINLDKRCSLVSGSSLERFTQVSHIGIDGPGDKRCFGTECDAQRAERMVDRTHRCALGDLAFDTGRTVLPLGQTINPIVEQHHVHIQIASQHMDEVIAADRKRIAVTGDHPNHQVGASRL